ncbi:hypothetical protein [Nocardia puris]|uniref:hypothetical protein n=1 Tax=Nocardia puris TaxID=208602 RepID=UPI0011BF282A|nr:hypothetical protein [Nocardia puris]
MDKKEFERQFAKLYSHIDTRLDSMEKSLASDIDDLREEVRTGFDQIASKLDDDEVERAAMSAQLARHERWHQKEASHLGITLQPDA